MRDFGCRHSFGQRVSQSVGRLGRRDILITSQAEGHEDVRQTSSFLQTHPFYPILIPIPIPCCTIIIPLCILLPLPLACVADPPPLPHPRQMPESFGKDGFAAGWHSW